VVPSRGGRLQDCRHESAGLILEELAEAVLFGLEDLVESRLRGVAAGHDVVDGRGVKATLGKQAEGGVEEPPGPQLAAPLQQQ
jgi:hypothetical protein